MNVPDQRWPDPSPMRRIEPTDAEIQAYAAYLKPLLLKSKEDVGELLAMATGAPGWDDFAKSIILGLGELAVIQGRPLLWKAAAEDAERIASDVLYGDDYHADTLKRIGAMDAESFFARQNA